MASSGATEPTTARPVSAQSEAENRAQPPAIPAPTRPLMRARAEADDHRLKGEALERRSMVRGLLVLGVVVLVLSMVRAGWDRVFVPGWWRQW